MRSWTRWVGIGAAVGIIAALVPVVQGRVGLEDLKAPLHKLEIARGSTAPAARPKLDGLDLLHLTLHPRRVTAPLSEGREAELTLDPDLQRVTRSIMSRYGLPESGAVLMDAKTGELLVYASHVNDGAPFDVNARAEAPAASVFKVVTGAALVEVAKLNATTEQCYHGGRSRIDAEELIDDPKRDKWCSTLAGAMGRSLNVVFARLAQKHLTPETLSAMGGALGFGAPIPFAVANDAPKLEPPSDPTEFARSAAGFWHSTLSPLAAASLAQTVANHGVALEPRIVRSVQRGRDVLWQDDSAPRVLRRAIRPETAAELTKMMLETVANGSAFKAFHDQRHESYLPGIDVAGKTGTLSRDEQNRFYTWFIGFAPAEDPQVAVAVLVVNTPTWRIKAAELARDVLRAYFVKKRAPGVTSPQ